MTLALSRFDILQTRTAKEQDPWKRTPPVHVPLDAALQSGTRPIITQYPHPALTQIRAAYGRSELAAPSPTCRVLHTHPPSPMHNALITRGGAALEPPALSPSAGGLP